MADVLIDLFSIPYAMRMKHLKDYSEINFILYSYQQCQIKKNLATEEDIKSGQISDDT